MNDGIQIVPLTRTSRNISRFLQVSYGIYQNDPLWVAPLLMDLKKVFTDANPLFQHAQMELWVATQGRRDVGRIAGIIDNSHNKISGDQAAFFGFFESPNDRQVSAQLFKTVRDWARTKGMKKLLGPMNPTTNDECGLLVKGFDSSPVFMMTYNPEYLLCHAGRSQWLSESKGLDRFSHRSGRDPDGSLDPHRTQGQRPQPQSRLPARAAKDP
jgi:hypothetical protein